MSVRLASILGTTIDIDLSFIIVAALFVLTAMQPGVPAQYALMWAPIVFVSVLLHELAHAATLALFGHGASRIILGGMGGVTINERPRRDWQQIAISAAGPASSFAITALSLAAMRMPLAHDPMFAAMLPAMARANVFWGVFNLLPILPLDGSQIVHSTLRMFVPAETAIRGAAWVSVVIGIAAVIGALYMRFIFAAIMIAMLVRVSAGALRRPQ